MSTGTFGLASKFAPITPIGTRRSETSSPFGSRQARTSRSNGASAAVASSPAAAVSIRSWSSCSRSRAPVSRRDEPSATSARLASRTTSRRSRKRWAARRSASSTRPWSSPARAARAAPASVSTRRRAVSFPATSTVALLYTEGSEGGLARSESREAEGTGPMKPRQPAASARCQAGRAERQVLGRCRAKLTKETAMPATHLSCIRCGNELQLEGVGACPRCFGPLEPVYDIDELRRTLTHESIEAGPPSLWRYAPLLPVRVPREPRLAPGLTPLVPATRLAAQLGLAELYLKLDTANPTHSFKDRVVAVACAKAQELGLETLACSS